MASNAATTSGAVTPLVGVIMGSRSDLRIMRAAGAMLEELGVPHEVRVVSAHRTPDWMFEYAEGAEVALPPKGTPEKTAQQAASTGARIGRSLAWPGLLRKLDRTDPSFRS